MEENNSGLGVLLRYMNNSNPTGEERQDWAALRTVAELAFLSGVSQVSAYPLLRLTASMGYLRSTDAVAGASYPLLFGLSEMEPPYSRRLLSRERPPQSLTPPQRRHLVEELVALAVDSARKGAYPALEALSRAQSATPSSSSSGVPRYPGLASLRDSSISYRTPLLHELVEEFLTTKVNYFADDEELLLDLERKRHQDIEVPQHRNAAFLFTKPHAFGPLVQEFVEDSLKANKIRVDRCGVISTEVVDKEGIIDKHYAAIARYAVTWPASKVVLSDNAKASFAKTFPGQNWDNALTAGKILNAKEASIKLGCKNGTELSAYWGKYPNRVKLGPGLYAAHFVAEGIFVINGFYPLNREKFTTPGGFINWYVISWNEADMSWKDFRGKFIGATNPADAPEGSLRRTILDKWKSLGLKYPPTVSENGIHASAGPLEGLAERLIWLPEHSIAKDVFGRTLIRNRVSPAFATRLISNPEVQLVDGRKGLVFDLLEDWQTSDALEAIVAYHGKELASGTPVAPLEALMTALGGERLKNLDLLMRAAAIPSSQVTAVVASSVPLPKPPVGPTSVRPRPNAPRGISSPYSYQTRESGAGLEAVFNFTIGYASSRQYAASSTAATDVKSAFLGLQLLHGAVVALKAATVPDRFLRIVTTRWEPSERNMQLRQATLPPLPPNRLAPAPPRRATNPLGLTVESEGEMRNPRHRITTAERIKNRTAKLQEEILSLTKRHDERGAGLMSYTNSSALGVSSQQQSPRSTHSDSLHTPQTSTKLTESVLQQHETATAQQKKGTTVPSKPNEAKKQDDKKGKKAEANALPEINLRAELLKRNNGANQISVAHSKVPHRDAALSNNTSPRDGKDGLPGRAPPKLPHMARRMSRDAKKLLP